MTFHRKFMYLVRRPQKPIILFLIIVFLYGLLQSFGKLQNSTKVYLENDEYRKVVARSQSWVQQNQNNDIEVDFLQNVVPLSRQQPRLIKILLKGTNDSDALKTDSDECCEQNYHPEADTEFNTFEIMKHVVASIGQTSNAPAREKPNVPKLQVFFLPMTHVDPGWLKTFDEYCPSTNAILDNMHQFLKEHPKMRFMWCEISFFEVWWSKVNETVKSDIKKMISNGQLEIASGSWVMSDEANPYFGSSVDNIIEGQQFVLNELGVKPTVIWSNDPFGYGPTIPYLFKKTGIRRAVINRIHHKIKQYLQSKRAIPFIWKQHFDSSNKSDVLTQVLPYTHYDILNSCGPARSVCCQFDFKRMTHFSCPGSKPVPITNENKAAKLLIQKDTRLSCVT